MIVNGRATARIQRAVREAVGADARLILTPELTTVLLDDRERQDGERQTVLRELFAAYPRAFARR